MKDWGLIERVLQARSLEDVAASAAKYARSNGFRNHGYAVRLLCPRVGGPADYRYFHDFDPDWGASYELLRNPEVEREDPRVLQARAGLPAAAWNARGQITYTRTEIGRRAKRLLQIASECGLRTGVTVPCHSPGASWAFLTFTSDGIHDVRQMTPAIASASYFASCLQAAMDRLLRIPQSMPRLTAREREVLGWSAQGKTAWEISVILHISERTVNFHLQQAARRLSVTNRRAAIARAVALGLVVP